jgi:pimeloyl-ACP methyl ester carboxylesterase
MRTYSITTRLGLTAQVRQYGEGNSSGTGGSTPVIYFHGLSGLFADEPFLEALAAAGHTVHAPTWPGYGDEPGEERLTDMQDFALHGWDLVDAISTETGSTATPHLMGLDLGAMIAAEMASLAPRDLSRLVLIGPLGLWLDAHPIADVFATLPFEFPHLLFADAAKGASLMTGGLDFEDPKAIEAFMFSNSRRLGTAGKVLFPIPNRRLSKRVYRLAAPTLLAWGDQDRFIPPDVYLPAWHDAIGHAQSCRIGDAGHLVTLEQPAELAQKVQEFLAR